MATDKTEQFDRADEIARRLEDKIEGKVDKLELKIESKLSVSIFQWIVGLLALIILGAFAFIGYQVWNANTNVSEKFDKVHDRLARIETRYDAIESRLSSTENQFQTITGKIETKYDTVERRLTSTENQLQTTNTKK
jgi:cytoskeletal protein RodZ